MEQLGVIPSGVLLALSGLAVALVQFAKWTGASDRYGPFLCLGVGVALVAVWAFDNGGVQPGQLLGYVFDAASVVLTASGAYGFARAITPSRATATETAENAARAPIVLGPTGSGH